MKFLLRGAIAAIALLVLVGASVRAEILEQIIVKVNGDIITKTEFEQKQVTALRQRNQQFSANQTDELKKAIAEITPQLIVDAIDELLLLQRGHELNYKLTDEQYNNVVEQIRKDNKLDSDEAFEAALRQEGMTVADLRRSLEKQMIISRVQGQEVMQKVGITEEEARKYHAEHQSEFTRPAQVTLRELLVSIPTDPKGVNVGAEEEAKQRAEDIRKRALGGEAFEKLAAELSDAPSKANGGLIGPLNSNELSPALQQLVSSMKPGEITEPLRTAKGYQLIQLESQTPAQVLKPEEVRDQIAERLYEQKRRVELKKYLEKLRSQAIIEWKNDELRKAYESVVGPPAPAAPVAPGDEAKPPAPPTN
jgi:peptidyl-prolyl cis-trans isomerase SurA